MSNLQLHARSQVSSFILVYPQHLLLFPTQSAHSLPSQPKSSIQAKLTNRKQGTDPTSNLLARAARLCLSITHLDINIRRMAVTPTSDDRGRGQ